MSVTQARAVAPILIALALASSACSRPRPVQARPALFLVADADTQIWLFGTVHVLPDNVRWESPAIDQAINQADALVTEIPDAQLRHGAATFDAIATAGNLPPALSRVPDKQRQALLAAIDSAGLTAAQADRLKTWALATIIASASARAAGASRDAGLETRLAGRFQSRGKPQRAFESLEGQLALFDQLSEADQRALLTATLADIGNPARGYRATLDAWASGDTNRIAASVNPLFGDRPMLEEKLLTGRNRRWAAWIAGRMRQPGTLFVAVGAGHLAGPKSVIAMLRARGLAVQRVQ